MDIKFLFFLLLLFPLCRAHADTPSLFIQEVYEQVLTVNRSASPKEDKIKRITCIMNDNIDFKLVAKFVLGKEAKKFAPQELEKFTQYYKDSVAKKYAKLLTLDIAFFKVLKEEKISDLRYIVHTMIRENKSGAEPLKLSYVLMYYDALGSYKLLDMIAAGGLSMANSDREEIQSFIKKNTLSDFKNQFACSK